MIYFYIFNNLRNQLQFLTADTWTVIIQAYHANEHPNEAWNLFQELESDGVVPSEYTLFTILIMLADMRNVLEGQRIHQLM